MTTKFALGIISAATGVAFAQTPVLDLTQWKYLRGSDTDGKVVVSGLTGPFHGPRKRLPLEVRLEWLDRNDYQENDSFLIRVRLMNRGTQAIGFPWEPDPKQVVSSSEAPLLRWLLLLRVEGTKNETFTFPVATLYGSALTPSTLRVMKPGEMSEIIADGTWRFLTAESAKRARITLSRDVRVSVRLAFLTSLDGHFYEDLESTNQIPVQFMFRERH
jgi:hypothetical protein